MEIFSWINSQLLQMDWLSSLIKFIVESFFPLSIDEKIGASIHFFIYDTIKIFILMTLLIFFVSYIQSYFPPERTKKILGGIQGLKGNIVAALLGTLTPFCSCSSIPIFIGFTKARLPLGITFSFLISSPMVDLASFLLLTSFFGIKIAMIYVIVGLLLAIIGGLLIDTLPLQNQIEPFVLEGSTTEGELEQSTHKQRVIYSIHEVQGVFKKVWYAILIGVGIGALIHNWIPTSVIELVIGEENPFAVLVATFVGVPIYADIFGALPIAEALFAKGIATGTILTFMMSVTALSLPSLIMLSKVVKRKLLATFIAIVTAGMIIIGYSFNLLQFLLSSLH